jgi:hypothetical protein
MRKRRAPRMASAMGMPTPTPTLRPRLELDLPPLLLLLRIAAALPDIVVSFAIIKEELWRRPTLSAHSYGYC